MHQSRLIAAQMAYTAATAEAARRAAAALLERDRDMLLRVSTDLASPTSGTSDRAREAKDKLRQLQAQRDSLQEQASKLVETAQRVAVVTATTGTGARVSIGSGPAHTNDVARAARERSQQLRSDMEALAAAQREALERAEAAARSRIAALRQVRHEAEAVSAATARSVEEARARAAAEAEARRAALVAEVQQAAMASRQAEMAETGVLPPSTAPAPETAEAKDTPYGSGQVLEERADGFTVLELPFGKAYMRRDMPSPAPAASAPAPAPVRAAAPLAPSTPLRPTAVAAAYDERPSAVFATRAALDPLASSSKAPRTPDRMILFQQASAPRAAALVSPVVLVPQPLVAAHTPAPAPAPVAQPQRSVLSYLARLQQEEANKARAQATGMPVELVASSRAPRLGVSIAVNPELKPARAAVATPLAMGSTTRPSIAALQSSTPAVASDRLSASSIGLSSPTPAQAGAADAEAVARVAELTLSRLEDAIHAAEAEAASRAMERERLEETLRRVQAERVKDECAAQALGSAAAAASAAVGAVLTVVSQLEPKAAVAVPKETPAMATPSRPTTPPVPQSLAAATSGSERDHGPAEASPAPAVDAPRAQEATGTDVRNSPAVAGWGGEERAALPATSPRTHRSRPLSWDAAEAGQDKPEASADLRDPASKRFRDEGSEGRDGLVSPPSGTASPSALTSHVPRVDPALLAAFMPIQDQLRDREDRSRSKSRARAARQTVGQSSSAPSTASSVVAPVAQPGFPADLHEFMRALASSPGAQAKEQGRGTRASVNGELAELTTTAEFADLVSVLAATLGQSQEEASRTLASALASASVEAEGQQAQQQAAAPPSPLSRSPRPEVPSFGPGPAPVQAQARRVAMPAIVPLPLPLDLPADMDPLDAEIIRELAALGQDGVTVPGRPSVAEFLRSPARAQAGYVLPAPMAAMQPMAMSPGYGGQQQVSQRPVAQGAVRPGVVELLTAPAPQRNTASGAASRHAMPRSPAVAEVRRREVATAYGNSQHRALMGGHRQSISGGLTGLAPGVQAALNAAAYAPPPPPPMGPAPGAYLPSYGQGYVPQPLLSPGQAQYVQVMGTQAYVMPAGVQAQSSPYVNPSPGIVYRV